MPKSRKTVLYVSPLPPPAGGIATWTSEIVQNGLPNPWVALVVNSRITGRTVADHSVSIPTETIRTFKILAITFFYLLFRRPQIIHVNCNLGQWGVFRDLLLILMSRIFFIKSVANLRGEYVEPSSGIIGNLRLVAYHLIFSFSGAIAVLDETSRSAVNTTHRSKSKVTKMPNFINLSAIDPPEFSSDGPFTCVFVGALIRSKGVNQIFDIAKKQPDVKFVLIGDTPDGDINKVKQDVLDQNLDDRIEITGPLVRDKVLQHLYNSSAFLLPTATEGFPLAVLEAMAVGLPVLSSFAGAIPEMVENGKGGWIIEHTNVEEYSAAITKLKSDPQLRAKMSSFNREKVLSHYEYSQVIKAWMTKYDDLLES